MMQVLRKYSFLTAFLLFTSVCLIHYFSQRPLWEDEAIVVKILNLYDYSEFFQEFNPAQSYPRAYLALVKKIGDTFDQHVLAYRFFPLIAMILAFLLWSRLFTSAWKEVAPYQLWLSAWISSWYMLYYAAELKPYSMDILIVGMFTWFLTRQGQFLVKREMLFAALLPLLMSMSYAALFIFWMIPFNYLLLVRGSRKFLIPMIISLVSSMICFGLFFYFDVRHSITIAGVKYWDSYFLCTESLACFGEPFGEGLKRLGSMWWTKVKPLQRPAILFLPFFLYGMFRYGIQAIKTHKGTLMHISGIGLMLFIELFVLGMLKKYPFTGGRLTLFFAPFIMYFIVRGLYDFKKVKYIGPVLWGYAHVYFLICFIFNTIRFIQLYFA